MVVVWYLFLQLFDFGLAKALPKKKQDRANYKMTGGTGSIRYMAPGEENTPEWMVRESCGGFTVNQFNALVLCPPPAQYHRGGTEEAM